MISIIIPAFNESKRLETTLKKITQYMGKRKYELLVIDDGSSDSTKTIAKKYATVYSHKVNKGKGAAIQTGLQKAKGDYILFTDADLATPIEELDEMLPHIKKSDMVIASRYMKSNKNVDQTLKRKIIGTLFSFLEKTVLQLPYKDTQCGCKLYTKKTARLLSKKQRIHKFAFDLEQLIIAKKNNLRVIEHPVTWFDKSGSTVRIVRDGTRMLIDVIIIKYNEITQKYS